MIGSPTFRKVFLELCGTGEELKELEAHKLVERTIVGDYPVKVVFTAEAYADTLTPLIYAMKDWGLNHPSKNFSAE